MFKGAVHLVYVFQGLKKIHGFWTFSRGFEINNGKISKPWDSKTMGSKHMDSRTMEKIPWF